MHELAHKLHPLIWQHKQHLFKNHAPVLSLLMSLVCT